MTKIVGGLTVAGGCGHDTGRLASDGICATWIGQVVVETEPEGDPRSGGTPITGNLFGIDIPFIGPVTDGLQTTSCVFHIDGVGADIR